MKNSTERKAMPPIEPPPPRYAEWREYFFGRCGKDCDVWQLDWDHDFDSATMAGCFAWCMNRAGPELLRYDNWHVANGLNLLLNDVHCLHDMLKPEVSEDLRLGVVASLGPLYRQCLRLRSAPVLSHRGEETDNPLGYITYMLWDISCLRHWIGTTNPTTGKSMLVETLGAVLCDKPNNPACIESVLHGFGHMIGQFPKYREQMQAEIDRFITTRPILRPELSAYAAAAYSGCVQ